MLEKQANPLTFLAHYISSKVSATGLTVTIDVWEVQQDGTAAEIVTAGSAVEVGDGLYRYVLASGSVDANAEYIAIFKTATSTVDQQHLAAVYSVGRAGVANLDAAASTIKADTAAILDDTGAAGVVVAAGSKTGYALSAAGIQAVWDALTSGLTTAGSIGKFLVDNLAGGLSAITAAIAALAGTTLTLRSVVDGNTVTVAAADTWDFDLAGLGDLTAFEVMLFIVKRYEKDSANDSIVYLRSDTGLIRLNKAAVAVAAHGSLTVGSGQVTVYVRMSATAGVTNTGVFTWWIKGLDTSADPDEGETIATGTFIIEPAGAPAII